VDGAVGACRSGEADFNFRRQTFRFALSQGLFSSAGIDPGTVLLLRFFSRLMDGDRREGRLPPRAVLDAGCGTGVIGICAAASLAGPGNEAPGVRCQDRDELARIFTEYNARRNGLGPERLSAHAEPLLAGPPGSRWDLILSNVPAKAGKPVLEDFVFRSAALLNPGGRALIVAVHPLADFFRAWIAAAGAPLLGEEGGPGYRVFLYGPSGAQGEPVQTGPSLLRDYPPYLRTRGDYVMEGTAYHLDAVQGAGDFDSPGGGIQAAAKLLARFPPEAVPPGPVLVHEGGPGHFPAWFAARRGGRLAGPLVLSGRNILALEAARHNVEASASHNGAPQSAAPQGATATGGVQLVPAADLQLGAEALLAAAAGRRFGFIAAFPELLPQSALPKEADSDLQSKSALAALWESLPPLLAEGGVCILTFSSADAERFDRKKPAGFTRLGDIKRGGFRALGYVYYV
jgi:SAM-dependent methyltransferase